MSKNVDQILETIDDVLEPEGEWFLLEGRRGVVVHTPVPGSVTDIARCGRGRVNRHKPYVPGDQKCETCTGRLAKSKELE